MEASEDLQFSDDEETLSVVYKPELAMVSAPTILLTLEAGIGNKTLPMLLLHLGFQSNVHDWSTNTVIIDLLYSTLTQIIDFVSHNSDEHRIDDVRGNGILQQQTCSVGASDRANGGYDKWKTLFHSLGVKD